MLDRYWQYHPVYRHVYVPQGFARNLVSGLIGFAACAALVLLFYPRPASADWYNGAWLYRKAITINPTKVAADQVNFPVLVSISDTSLAANALPSGDDILFTSSDGTTKLSHEIESYTSTGSGTLVAWVKVPNISSTSATMLYMYYGNRASPSQQDRTNVWDSNFKGVWHMKEASGDVSDATANSNILTDNSTTSVTGQIGGARSFSGSITSHLTRADDADFDFRASVDYSISMWVNTTQTSASFPSLIDKEQFSPSRQGLEMYLDSTDSYQIDAGEYNGGADIGHLPNEAIVNDGSWHQIVYKRSGTTISTYKDGALIDSLTQAGTDADISNTAILDLGGMASDANNVYNGKEDEVHISNSARSWSWIQTEYNNQATPSAFLTVGRQQMKKQPVLYWKFDEGTGSTAYDTTTASASGTISGATWQSRDVCLFEGSCLKFDGTNDSVRRLHDVSGDPWCNNTNALHGCTATWSARMKIQFSGNVSSTPLTNFPVLVKLDSTRIDYGKTQSGGQDIRFVDANAPNTVLPHEIESWNTSGTSYVWVKVPQIDANSRTDYIMMYYGNTAPDGQQKTSVWDGNYKSVWHLNESPASTCVSTKEFCDSTSNGAHGDQGNMAAGVQETGKIGGSIHLDGSNDEVNVASITTSTTDWTLETWMNPDTFTAGVHTLFCSNQTTCDTWYLQLFNGELYCGIGNSLGEIGTSSWGGTAGNWYHIVCTYNNTTHSFQLYSNGTLMPSTITQAWAGSPVGGTNAWLGATGGSGQEVFDGYMDEARTSNSVRSPDWIKASYLTENDQFITYAPEGSDPKLDPGTGSFSVGAWFRHPTSLTGTDTLIARTDGVNGVGYKLTYDATNGLCFGIDGTAGSFPSDRACANTSFADNRWHYVEGVKSGTSWIKLYVDGKEADVDGSITSSSLSGVSPPFLVGMDADGATNPWDGFIDEVRVYDYARSANEVKADYAAKGGVLGASTSLGAEDPNSSLSQGLAGYWKLDDGVGNPCASGVHKACDSSGNGNVGTWTSGVASTSGKFGYATNVWHTGA